MDLHLRRAQPVQGPDHRAPPPPGPRPPPRLASTRAPRAPGGPALAGARAGDPATRPPPEPIPQQPAGRHERGIHVVRLGTDGVRVTEVRFLGWRRCWREM